MSNGHTKTIEFAKKAIITTFDNVTYRGSLSVLNDSTLDIGENKVCLNSIYVIKFKNIVFRSVGTACLILCPTSFGLGYFAAKRSLEETGSPVAFFPFIIGTAISATSLLFGIILKTIRIKYHSDHFMFAIVEISPPGNQLH